MSTNDKITEALSRAEKAGPALQAYVDEMRNRERELEKLKAQEIIDYEDALRKLNNKHSAVMEDINKALSQVRGTISAFDPARAKVAEGFRVISKPFD